MKKKIGLPVPLYYLVLDTLGAILLGLGLAKHFAGLDIIPPVLRFEAYGTVFMAAGIVLMLPAVVHLLGRARGSR